MNTNKSTGRTFTAGRFFVVLLAFLMLATFSPPGSAFKPAEVNAASDTVSTWDDLVTAVGSAEDGDTITVTANLGATGTITLDEEKNITIKGNDVGIYRDYSGTALSNIESLFKVEKGTLTLGEGLTLSGKVLCSDAGHEGEVDNWNYRKGHIKSGTRGFFVEVAKDGKLVIDGATIQDYTTEYSVGSPPRERTRDNLPTGLSPVYVQGGFEMKKGSITGNRVSAVNKATLIERCQDDGNRANAYIQNHGVLSHRVNGYSDVNWLSRDGADNGAEKLGAGAVYFDGTDATYSISGGTISGNQGNAGAIIVNKGTLDIKGNTEIFDNFGDHTSTIFVASDDATVRMCGGAVRDNFGTMGGGVLAGDNGKFFLMGGTIDNNYTPGSGGGILVYSNNVFLLSGKITNNKSAVFGGGIYVYGNDDDRSQSYTTVISKADIKQNTAVYTETMEADDNAMSKGIITADNSQSITVVGEEAFQRGSGGGIWLCPAGIATFDATSVNLSDNTADRQNADFHKDAGFKGGLLIDFGPHDRLADWVHDEYASGRTKDIPFTYEEATSGMSEMFGIVNIKNVDHNPDAWVEITGNASRRGGGVGSNGTVLFMTPGHGDVNIDNGTLKYKKEFKDMAEEPMEYDMILANAKGEPVLNKDKKEIRIATFRLFDADYAAGYETQRTTKGSDIYGQGEAKWSADYSEIDLTFPKGNDDANFFTTDDPEDSKLYVLMREYRINPTNNKRGTQVSEQIFRSKDPVHTETILKDEQEITYYPNYVPCTSGQGCDNCDPGEPNTFKVASRDFNFDASGENKEVPEIEKYINEAVHSDIKLNDEFTYNILAYVTTDADEMVVTDTLNDQLKFASSKASDVKVYDLGMTTDREEGLNIPIDSNHLPVYDVSGNPIDNGKKTPSVQTGTAIKIKDNEYSKVTIVGQTLMLKLANKMAEAVTDTETETEKPVYKNADDDQELTDLRGHWLRIEFKAKLTDDVAATLESGAIEVSELTMEEIKAEIDYPDGIPGDRGEPHMGNDPVKSNEDHKGIANTASYEIKVANEAKYQDTSNTVTVKPAVEKKEEEDSKPDKEENKPKPDNEESNSKPENEEYEIRPIEEIDDLKPIEEEQVQKAVKTGDDTPIALLVLAVLASAAAFEYLRRRRAD